MSIRTTVGGSRDPQVPCFATSALTHPLHATKPEPSTQLGDQLLPQEPSPPVCRTQGQESAPRVLSVIREVANR